MSINRSTKLVFEAEVRVTEFKIERHIQDSRKHLIRRALQEQFKDFFYKAFYLRFLRSPGYVLENELLT